MTKKEKEAIKSLEAALVKLENITQETIKRLVSEEEYLNYFEKWSYKKKRPATLFDYYKTRIMEISTKLAYASTLMRAFHGWVCPKCGKVNVFWMQTCPCQSLQQEVPPSKWDTGLK
jgi:predicted RNA-binding Zn-ribbon protein involved in translation (DUF1610 family)